MSSEPSPQESTAQMQSIIERLITSRNRDLSLFIPFLLGLTFPDPDPTRPNPAPNSIDPVHNSPNQPDPDGQNPGPTSSRDRIILINPVTQGIVVIEGTGLDSLFRGTQDKCGPPPASKSSIQNMPSVVVGEQETDDDPGPGECVICLEEYCKGVIVKEMPCKHRFHGGCIEKWLGLHGSCPVCRFAMPVEEEEVERKEEREGGEGERRREIWVSFSFGSGVSGSGLSSGSGVEDRGSEE